MVRMFISWSGPSTQQLAELLKEWLRDVVHEADVYVSSTSIERGTRWTSSVHGALEEIDLGAILLTSENRTAPWLMYEAGALSKNGKALVVPILCNIQPTDLPDPLRDRQAVLRLNEAELFELARLINARAERVLDDARLRRSFDRAWPELEAGIAKIDFGAAPPQKPQNEVALANIENSLARIVRSLDQAPSPWSYPSLGSLGVDQNPPPQPMSLFDLGRVEVRNLIRDERANRVRNQLMAEALMGAAPKGLQDLDPMPPSPSDG